MPCTPLPARLLLIRHGESAWNHEQRFTGWADVGLTVAGERQMDALGRKLRADGVAIDALFTSVLLRCTASASALLQALESPALPQVFDWRLNERHYGALTGRYRQDAVAEFGAGAVRSWRRSYRAVPPPLDLPALARIAPLARTLADHADPASLPLAESLEQTALRVAAVWRERILPAARPGRTIAVIGHGNSLRALVMLVEGMGEAEITTLEIANGESRLYLSEGNGRFGRPAIWRPPDHLPSQVL